MSLPGAAQRVTRVGSSTGHSVDGTARSPVTSRTSATRTGGDLVVESLHRTRRATVFGIPGQHALGTFSALAGSDLHYVGLRTELSAGFAADGYARATGTVGPLLVSTGPGALISLAALQEAAASSVPLLVVSSARSRAPVSAAFAGVSCTSCPSSSTVVRGIVKSAERVRRSRARSPGALAAAWETALSPPHGPVWVEIPQDVLLGEVDLPPGRAIYRDTAGAGASGGAARGSDPAAGVGGAAGDSGRRRGCPGRRRVCPCSSSPRRCARRSR